MAELDLEQLAREYGDPVPLERVAALVDELQRRRQQAEADLRAWQHLVDEHGSLKRRITALRRGLFDIETGTTIRLISDMARWAREADTACRRRFELRQRKGSRRG